MFTKRLTAACLWDCRQWPETSVADRGLGVVRDHWQSIFTPSNCQFGGGAAYLLKRILTSPSVLSYILLICDKKRQRRPS